VTAPDANGRWRVEHLLDEPVQAVVPTGHPAARRRRVDIASLAGDSWVMQAPASPCQELVMRVCATAGFAPRVSATCGDYRSILRLVAAGHGVSLVPELALDAPPQGVCALPTQPSISRRINALVPHDRVDEPAVRIFVGALRAEISRDPATPVALAATRP
jgi:DNA-binding transcriptional LysR family regulator